MMGRRGMLAGMAAGGLPLRRIDQRAGLEGHRAGVGPAPANPIVIARKVIIVGTTGGLFVYSPAPGPGNLVASIAANPGTDPYGNTYPAGITEYSPPASASGAYVQLFNPGVSAELIFGTFSSTSTITQVATESLIDSAAAGARPGLWLLSPRTSALGGVSVVLFGESQDGTKPQQVVVTGTSGTPAGQTVALFEVQGPAAPSFPPIQEIAAAAGDRAYGVLVTGDTNNRMVINSNGQISWGPGSAGADANFGRLASATVGTNNSDFDVSLTGKGLRVAEGANGKQGTATLAAGTILVNNTSVTASSRIFLTAQDNNSTGALRVSARVAGTSFTITSSNAADSGVVAFEIFEPG